ncbi:hypothetical protein BDP27DRAFT_1376702 [Rhodocollybia butyracea]|uniref:Uncharacterized protein n=1 Tax=Rhodocollybia butyracea TaxID=206335 RepID=A0A9P5P392_9AGAR|nr:hypothetical protein BDP27DRAFT_1376702 [Rhodocollybia butyracea]
MKFKLKLRNNDGDPDYGPLAQQSPLSSAHSSPLSTSPPSPMLLKTMLPSEPNTMQDSPKKPLTKKQKRKQERGKERSKRCRKKRRQDAPQKTAEDIPARKNPTHRFVPNNAAFQVSFSLDGDAPIASTAYVGLWDEGITGGQEAPTLKVLIAQGFSVIKAQPGATVPLADTERRVFGVIVYPDNPSLAKCAEDAAELLRDSRQHVSFTAKQRNSRRGHFGQLNVGLAHGGDVWLSRCDLFGSLLTRQYGYSSTRDSIFLYAVLIWREFSTEDRYKATRTAEEAKVEEVRKVGRWEMGLSLLCVIMSFYKVVTVDSTFKTNPSCETAWFLTQLPAIKIDHNKKWHFPIEKHE